MNDDNIKQLIREMLKPALDELVELNFKIFSNITNSLPTDMSEEQKLDLVKGVLKSHGDALVTGIKTSIPKDFDTKLKEAYNGRRP